MTDAAGPREASRAGRAPEGREGGPSGADLAAPPASGGDGLARARPRAGSPRCPYCREDVAPDRAARCAACTAPHHLPCWAEHGACAACRATAVEGLLERGAGAGPGPSAALATSGRPQRRGPAPPALAPELARELAPDEVLLWHGAPAPEPWSARLNRGAFLALAGVAGAGVLLIGLAAGLDGLVLAALMGVELALVLRSAFQALRRRARLEATSYALTDRRVLVLEGPPGRRFGRSRPLDRLVDVQLERAGRRGRGTIALAFAADPGDEPVVLEDLEDLDAVLTLAHAAHARARRTKA